MIKRHTAPTIYKGREFYAVVLVAENGNLERWSLVVGNVNLSQITLEQLDTIFGWTQEDIDAMNEIVREQMSNLM